MTVAPKEDIAATRAGEATAPAVYRVGTLAYTKAGLFLLFFWLLAGDVVFVLIDQIEPRILPVLLKAHGATDQQVALIVSSLPALINFAVNPIVSYRSDRKRSRWGRRIPYLFWATPFVTLFLALTPFAPEIAKWALRIPWVARGLQAFPWAPVIVAFAALVLLYQLFQKVVGSVYFYLFRDVVPASHLGRFLTLFRVFGALATFGLNYWMIGLAETHPEWIFLGVAALNLVGFLAMCWFVREGDYPPVVETVRAEDSAAAWSGLVLAGLNFLVESFRSPIYWWTYLTRLLIYASVTATSFLIFFSRDELGLSLDRTGKLMSWASFAWLLVAYPVGLLLDRWGAIRMLKLALWLLAASCAASFFLVVGDLTFLVSSIVTGTLFWMAMLAQLMLAQEIFHPQRMGQLSSANGMVQSLLVAFLVGPLTGWLLDALKPFHATLVLPLAGEVTIGAYRFLFLLLAAIYFLSLLSLYRVRHHWLRLGGRDHYQPPL